MNRPAAIPDVCLTNEVAMPAIGFGLFEIPDTEMQAVIDRALAVGYRGFDTAPMYENERSLGRALARSGVPREELFVTTKISNEDQGHLSTLDAFEASADRLGLGYVDMVLIHWPAPRRGQYMETWRALEELYMAGRIRVIGVSNFQPEQLRRLAASATVIPAVNQIELHPLLTQHALLDLHRSLGIQTQAWAPLARGRLRGHPVLAAIADRHHVTPERVILRWHLQVGTVPLPKSATPQRITDNINVFGFHLSAAEMNEISALNRNERTGPHPDDVD
jgi:diketogulonate reductase-like aldo/keto reductase